MTLALINITYADYGFLLLAVFLGMGFAALTYGGDVLTKGAAAISVNFKIDPIVVGLTVVSIATSMPEMATSLMAAGDNPGIALGNILGSNIANIGLILGITALIAPLAVQHRLIVREVPMLLIVSLLFTVFAFGGGFSRIEGVVLLFLTLLYLVYVVKNAQAEPKGAIDGSSEEIPSAGQMKNSLAVVLVIIGGALLALGADFLVGASVEIATRMGVSDLFIGLTIVAIGTSLPELAASIAAVRSGHGDLCAGNIVGSNLFNILLIGGGVATFVPIDVASGLLRVEFPAMLVLTGCLLWFFRTGSVVTRREGAVLLVSYFVILTLSGLSQFGMLVP